MILPINIKESDFKTAIAKFEAMLGKDVAEKAKDKVRKEKTGNGKK